MDHVKTFNAELVSLYDMRPPISKAKMTSITKAAIRAMKYYKHVVQGVEKFILKCRPEYKIPGLYVIDSIVRQSRHQFGIEKDVFAPRFTRNIHQTFENIFECPSDEKKKVARVLNLWKRNQVFPKSVIKSLFAVGGVEDQELLLSDEEEDEMNKDDTDLRNTEIENQDSPVNTTEMDQSSQQELNDVINTIRSTAASANSAGGTSAIGSELLQQLQAITALLQQSAAMGQTPTSNQTSATSQAQAQVMFDNNLLDFDYGEEDDDGNMRISPAFNPQITSNTTPEQQVASLLSNQNVLRQLQSVIRLSQEEQSHQHNTNAGGVVGSSNSEFQNQFTQQQHLAEQQQQIKLQEQLQQQHLQQQLHQQFQRTQMLQQFHQQQLPQFPQIPPFGPFQLPTQQQFAQLAVAQAQAVQSHQLSPFPGMTQPPLQFPPQISQLTPQQLLQMSQIASQVSEPPSGRMENLLQKSQLEQPSPGKHRESQERNDTFSAGQNSSFQRNKQDTSHVEDDDGDDGPEFIMEKRPDEPLEVIDLVHVSTPPSPPSRSRTRSRSRSSRRRHNRTRSRSRSYSPEKERERRRRALPPRKKHHLSVCSRTLWVGHLNKLVQEQDLSDLFGEIGDIVSIDLIPPRGCAFLCMNRRQDAAKALDRLRHYKLTGKSITLAWAPGKGMKGREWKEYWEVENGVSYIPWSKLSKETDYDFLEDGGVFDFDTVPEWLKKYLNERPKSNNSQSQKQLLKRDADLRANSFSSSGNSGNVNFIPLPESSTSTTDPVAASPKVSNSMSSNVDPVTPAAPTISLPKVSGSQGIPPAPVGIMNPFGLPPRLLSPMDVPLRPPLMNPMGVPPPVSQLLPQISPMPSKISASFNPPGASKIDNNESCAMDIPLPDDSPDEESNKQLSEKSDTERSGDIDRDYRMVPTARGSVERDEDVDYRRNENDFGRSERDHDYRTNRRGDYNRDDSRNRNYNRSNEDGPGFRGDKRGRSGSMERRSRGLRGRSRSRDRRDRSRSRENRDRDYRNNNRSFRDDGRNDYGNSRRTNSRWGDKDNDRSQNRDGKRDFDNARRDREDDRNLIKNSDSKLNQDSPNKVFPNMPPFHDLPFPGSGPAQFQLGNFNSNQFRGPAMNRFPGPPNSFPGPNFHRPPNFSGPPQPFLKLGRDRILQPGAFNDRDDDAMDREERQPYRATIPSLMNIRGVRQPFQRGPPFSMRPGFPPRDDFRGPPFGPQSIRHQFGGMRGLPPRFGDIRPKRGYSDMQSEYRLQSPPPTDFDPMEHNKRQKSHDTTTNWSYKGPKESVTERERTDRSDEDSKNSEQVKNITKDNNYRDSDDKQIEFNFSDNWKDGTKKDSVMDKSETDISLVTNTSEKIDDSSVTSESCETTVMEFKNLSSIKEFTETDYSGIPNEMIYSPSAMDGEFSESDDNLQLPSFKSDDERAKEEQLNLIHEESKKEYQTNEEIKNKYQLQFEESKKEYDIHEHEMSTKEYQLDHEESKKDYQLEHEESKIKYQLDEESKKEYPINKYPLNNETVNESEFGYEEPKKDYQTTNNNNFVESSNEPISATDSKNIEIDESANRVKFKFQIPPKPRVESNLFTDELNKPSEPFKMPTLDDLEEIEEKNNPEEIQRDLKQTDDYDIFAP